MNATPVKNVIDWERRFSELARMDVADQGASEELRFHQIRFEKLRVDQELTELHQILGDDETLPAALREELAAFVEGALSAVQTSVDEANQLIKEMVTAAEFRARRQRILDRFAADLDATRTRHRAVVFAAALSAKAIRTARDRNALRLASGPPAVRALLEGRLSKSSLKQSNRFAQSSLNRVASRVHLLSSRPMREGSIDAAAHVADLLRLQSAAVSEVNEILSVLEKHGTDVDGEMLDDLVSYMHLLLGRVEVIDEYASPKPSKHIPSEEFPETQFVFSRRALRAFARETGEQISSRRPGVFALLRALDKTELRSLASDISSVQDAVDELSTSVDEKLKRLSALEVSINRAMDKFTVARIVTSYAEQVTVHGDAERMWINWSIAALMPLICIVSYIFGTPIPEPLSSGSAISAIVGRTLLFTLAAAFLQFTVKRWNLERDMQLRYRHRIATVDQYKDLERMVSDAEEGAKDRLRTALAKYLFSDPQTGYGNAVASELNVSPLIQIGESLAKKRPVQSG